MPLSTSSNSSCPVRACAYDRAGYGFSQTSLPYPDVDNSPVMIYDVLTKIGESREARTFAPVTRPGEPSAGA